jgi:hypothetical protein
MGIPGTPTPAPALSPDEVADEPNCSKKKKKAVSAPADSAELPSLDFFFVVFFFIFKLKNDTWQK